MKGSDLRKQNTKRPMTMTELRDQLGELFEALGNARVPPDQAKELSNIAGKMIKSACAQIEYANMRKEKHEIPFLK